MLIFGGGSVGTGRLLGSEPSQPVPGVWQQGGLNRQTHKEACYLGIGTVTITKLPYGPQGRTPSNIRDESNTILCRIVKGNRCNMFMKVKGNHILKHNVIHKVKQIILIRNKVIKELSI